MNHKHYYATLGLQRDAYLEQITKVVEAYAPLRDTDIRTANDELGGQGAGDEAHRDVF
jgi:hypothetical protein